MTQHIAACQLDSPLRLILRSSPAVPLPGPRQTVFEAAPQASHQSPWLLPESDASPTCRSPLWVSKRELPPRYTHPPSSPALRRIQTPAFWHIVNNNLYALSTSHFLSRFGAGFARAAGETQFNPLTSPSKCDLGADSRWYPPCSKLQTGVPLPASGRPPASMTRHHHQHHLSQPN